MKKFIYIALSACVLHVPSFLNAQSTSGDQPWHAIKASVNFSVFSKDETPRVVTVWPVGRVIPTFAWGRSQRRWWEVSVPVLSFGQTNTLTTDAPANTRVSGSLKTVYYTGVYAEFNWNHNRHLGKMPVYYSVGILPRTGKFEFRSEEIAQLDRNSTLYAADIYLGPKLIWLNSRHWYAEAQGYMVFTYSNYRYQYLKLDGAVPTASTNTLQSVPVGFQARITVGYRL